jgi:hypothetical protein
VLTLSVPRRPTRRALRDCAQEMLANTVLSRTSHPLETASRVEDEWSEVFFFMRLMLSLRLVACVFNLPIPYKK